MSRAYYNENDPKAAAWLRELIFEGLIAWGDVDERSIEDVRPSELVGYEQCHFFAGIGGWSYALRLAGWPDDKPVWTGSCPCQPFSAAGKGKGFADERHLWPAWHHLIREHRPGVIFGEQVASKAGLNWFALVHADLEGTGYSTCCVDLCAASVGAPHIRQRLYWVGIELGDTSSRSGRDTGTVPSEEGGAPGEVRSELDESQPSGVLGHTGGARLERRGVSGSERGSERTPWTPSDVVWCRDGKWRPVEPGTFPLAHGIPGRVGLLRGYGNAIVPQVAAAFIEATGLA